MVIFGESLPNDAAMYVILSFHPHIHVIVINSKESIHNFTDPRSTRSLFRGIGLSSRIQLSMILRVAFGLVMPLVLKYSSLVMHPSIGSCQVASCAYMCSFFFNGPSVGRGIVSLLVSGSTLKH